MKFAYVILKVFHHGGLQKSFLSILDETLKRGHEVTVYTWSWEGSIPKGCHVQLIESNQLTNHGKIDSFINQLSHYLNQNHYDCIVGFNKIPFLDIYYCGDVCYLDYTLKKKSKLLMFFVRMTPRFQHYTRFEQSVFNRGARTKILSISKQHNADYQRFYETESERFYDLPPGINKAAFTAARIDKASPNPALLASITDLKQSYDISNDANLFLMIGTDFKRKGLDRVIKALSLLEPSVRKNTVLAVIGEGKSWRYQKIAKVLGVEDNIRYIGASKEVPTWIAGAHAVIHAAYFETAGSAILEAIVAGKPVLVTANCGFAFHVDEAKAGMVLPDNAETSTQLARAIETSIRDDELYSSWCSNAVVYADSMDLYSRKQRAVDLIEQLSQE